MAARIRTLNFLPEVFRTPTNAQFLGATLDQVVDQPNTMRIQGYIGSKFGYGINAKDKYVVEPTKTRTDYQLDPGVVFTKTNTATATDFITYPGIIDALKINGGVTDNNDRLFNSQFYSWDPFVNLDMLINFNQYYWLPEGPPSVTIGTDVVYNIQDYNVVDEPNAYLISSDVNPSGSANPTITLIRGGTYTFTVNQNSGFWIQGKPGVTGYDPTQPNLQTRDIFGVSNNGAEAGIVEFNVPYKNAQDEYNFPGNNIVDVVSSAPFDAIQGQLLSDVVDIDGVTALEGLTVMFYNTGVPNEQGFVGQYYDTTLFDQDGGNPYVYPGSSLDDNNFGGGYYTDVTATFYQVTYVGDPTNPVIKLIPYGGIPTNQKITAKYGTQWKARDFYRNIAGSINLIPYLSSLLDTLYYQDGTNSNKVGIIRLIDNNSTNQINVLDILGKKNYTAPNGVVFTNGLKVSFDGDIYPTSYKSGEYYVEGVGTAIELINVQDLIVPEPFTGGVYVPYDTTPYDIGNYDVTLYIPINQDYITIARNSIDRNPWSRSNRWFHIDVINATASYNNDPSIATTYATQDNKAKRPIIEFYPNLKLFDNCIVGKKPIDFFDVKTTDAFTQVAGQTVYYPDVEVYTASTGAIDAVVSGTSTTVTIPANDVLAGVFQVGQYITDSAGVLPRNTQITNITGTSTLTLTVEWENSTSFASTLNVSLVANDISNDNYALFDGARIVFSIDSNPNVKNKIYTVHFSTVDGPTPVITLTEAEDGLVLENEGTFAFKGYYNQGKDFFYYFNDDPTVLANEWKLSQQKTIVNQAPYFDVFDSDGISFGNKTVYTGSSFTGNKLFSYGIGSGINDIVLGFPLRYSSVNNVGDISFDVPLNSATFNYVRGNTPYTKKVNTGYVYNYSDLGTAPVRQLGWQTAVAESRQYQIFSFNYVANSNTNTYTCDIAASTDTVWPNIQVYVNNVLQDKTSYTYSINPDSTVVTFTVPDVYADTVVEIAILSDQVSKTAYYQVPINLQNNPFNGDITTANVGDIRGQYQSIFYNNPDTSGKVFGANNYRDLGNLVPWGNKIIQNSASLVLPGTFLRKPGVNLYDSLQYNNNQYILFKTLLMDTVNNTEYTVYQTPATMLDDALDQITDSKVDTAPFFWSDMLPGKSTYVTNTYTFANSLDISRYPLTRIYDFTKANYYGVLVYLTRTVDNFTTIEQLIKGVDYTVSADSPSLTVTTDLLPGDIITIKEYNQTYGSYVPNTPTKLGLYPSFIPSVVLDENYTNPTYFIRGHDGSYTKLYGDYIDGNLVDFRDKVLLEFETRIYNNLKLSNVIPIRDYDVVPGFFRDSQYSYDEFLSIYSQFFLNWVGQNRVQYKDHIGYTPSNQFSYNYNQSGNKINNSQILQGYWRGVYQYFYDTSEPDTSPWEMIGFTDKPTWWETRYGPAPYTSDNLVLWGDLAAGINWNNGDPVVIPQCVRPQLLQVIPVDSQGNLLSPFDSIVGNYQDTSFRNPWKVGDVAPTEFAYRRSSSWPFDLMKILALTKPAEFYNLGVDVDNYKYNEEFNQFLVNDRSHLVISDVEIYGNGTAKTSYINWIVDYEKQVGIDSTQTTTDLLDNLDVRLVYRVAGFTDKTLVNFYVEKGTPNSRNASLLIPSESLNVLLYDNVPFNKILYSGVIVQNSGNGWKVYGNSQTKAYFTVSKPKINGNYRLVTVEGESVQLAIDYFENSEVLVPYGTEFVSKQDLAQFLASYGNYLQTQGMLFDEIEAGTDINWRQMVAEYLYWTQSGWGLGSLINLNPAANLISIDKDSFIVQPLTLQRQNFILNQNLYPIQAIDMAVVRDGTLFTAKPLNQGDTVAYGQFNITNFEHGVVFDNVTLFNDVLYNLVTGLRQNRILTRGTKTADWNGTIDAQGFILNQDNIQEWNNITKYTKGSIVKYKNKYWVALKVLEPSMTFDAQYWKETDYDEIQKGLLPNPSTRSYESTLFYNTNQPNLNKDSDLLSWSLIGYRPRDYLALADLTDITQVNVYKNLIKEKGTRVATENFRGLQLPQGGIDYQVYESWAIKTGEFGGVLDSNFIDFRLNETSLTANPSTVGLTTGDYTDGVQQEVPLYTVFNYGRPITDPNVLPTLPVNTPNKTFPDAGYVNFDDITTYGYYYNDLNTAQTPLDKLYAGEYVWIADYLGTWQVYTPISTGTLVQVINNLNSTVTLEFAQPHGLSKFQTIAIINFNDAINGYRIVQSVIDNYKVVVSLALASTVLRLTGNGIVMRFQSQRVEQPSDVANLPLLNTEFVKNKVWVDTNDTGDWAVYRKSINYQYDKEILKTGSLKFGSAVATTNDLGYLITDSELGKAYRYVYNPVFQRYELAQELIGGTSFGTSIGYAGNTFAISQPTGTLLADRKVKIYELVVSVDENQLNEVQVIQAPTGITNWGSKTEFSGDGNWLFISAYEQNIVYIYRKSTVTGLYEYSTAISLPELVAGDNFSFSLATNYYGNTMVVGAPGIDTGLTNNTGKAYIFERLVQNFEVQYASQIYVPQTFNLSFTPQTQSRGATSITSNAITLSSVSGINVDMPVIFTGNVFGGVQENTVYYIKTIVGSTITLSLTRGGSTLTLVNGSGTMNAIVQAEPLYVNVNGTTIPDNTYAITGTTLNVYKALNAGDIINVSGSTFVLIQIFTATGDITIGEQYGYSADLDTYGNELLIGSPYQINTQNKEGVIYRYTDGGGKYGIIIGTIDCQVTTPTTILLNGYAVALPIGNAQAIATAIQSANLTNITASAVNNKIVISLINQNLGLINDKLDISAINGNTLYELGISKYTSTQQIVDPHPSGRTQFGSVVKFNTNGSFVTSAPAAARYELTTFDSTDDDNYDNDTLFDNNTTQFQDIALNAGAVYMFDYLSNYNENLTNVGNFVYAQSVNALNIDYGNQPYYGTAIDFNDNTVVIGTPNFRPGYDNGQVVVYQNQSGLSDWSVFRQPQNQVDINSIQNAQLYSASTNNTLINLDYFDPLQGKLLGVVAQNLDIISNADPASYNSPDIPATGSAIWGAKQVGQLWFDTSTTKFVNYHQNNEVVYNSKYWGKVFPGSQVAIYSWITSNVTPDQYTGSGTPYSLTNYSIEYVLNATGAIVPVYFYWVRNTNIVFNQLGKTLSDTICESYITAPQASGIAYFAPIQSNVMGLYNCGEYINANDTVMHLGFATGTNDDVSHSVYSLIRDGFPDDFLPGLPGVGGVTRPESLYDRMLDSLSGVDESGAIVPDPYLPKPVQSGILVRPRQSFFYNRFGGLKNYLTYANELLKQRPFIEAATAYKLLFAEGPINPSNGLPFYKTSDYWEYINWWAVGYNDNTRSAMMVDYYYQLATIPAQNGLIVTVKQNGAGLQETYVYNGFTSTWDRIGLQNGTIQFKSSLWDYESARIGFGDNFFDTTPFDSYPSEETRSIVRFLNEDLPEELNYFRNKALILLFNYIVSETIESQNYIPWLNKTSFIDVEHKIRELLPLEVFQSDNQDFLAGYINEVKPYHVVVKDFLFKYTGSDLWAGNITDFDLPAQYNTNLQQYMSPELVFANPSGDNQYLPTDSIWQDPAYVNWYNNYGVSITGVDGYAITTLSSYLTLNSNSMVVDNVYGFPINGVIKIYDPADPETDLSKKAYELIAYSSVDRAYGTLNGLTRGVNGTPISTHLPGQQIYIDLPAVLVLDSGRGYINPPKITAYIDTTKYPAPRREAILKPVMNIDTLLSVEVVDPGDGYVVLPQIVIEPSSTITFSSLDVDLINDTIAIQNQILQTGDLVKYIAGTDTTPVGGVKNNQYYYVNVLETTPNFTIALYTSYADALQDRDRVVFTNTGTGSNNKLEVSARASCVTRALPIRENIMTLRYDRTSYTSRVTEWTPGNFYGSFYAGSLLNSEQVASSSILIAPPEFGYTPPIENILASAQGAPFEIQSITNDEVVDWSSLTRNVTSIDSLTDVLTLTPPLSTEPNASGSTIGFYVGMPVKFEGAVTGNIVIDATYYVTEIVSETEFKINLSMAGTSVGPAGLTMYVGEVTNTGVIAIQYPGILTATETQKTTNYITIPTIGGKYGTSGWYTGLPIFFTGTTFGNVIENETYYVTAVVDDQTFTMSTKNNPTVVSVVQTEISGNLIKLSELSDLEINTPVIVNDMMIAGANVTDFGGIISGTVYYIASIDYTTNKVTLSTAINSGAITITADIPPANDTSASMISQIDVVQLSTATGSMTCNVGLPISPGQINGQLFTFYKTSGEFTNGGAGYTGTYSNLITRDTVATVSGDNYLYLNVLNGGTTYMYDNMPFRVADSVGGLSTGTTYYVESIGTISVEVTSSSSSGNKYTCASTAGFYPTMPISFSGGVFGFAAIQELVTYYVKSVVNSTQFTVTDIPGGTEITLSVDNGSMTLKADNPYITVKDSLGASVSLLSSGDYSAGTFVVGQKYKIKTIGTTTQLQWNTIAGTSGETYSIGTVFTCADAGVGLGDGVAYTYPVTTTLTQYPTAAPYFYISYILGGYSVTIYDGGEGFAYNNNIIIPGSSVGGVNGINDIIVNVSGINESGPNYDPLLPYGAITSTIVSGTTPGLEEKYYLKVISPTELKVYSNSLMTAPVDGNTLGAIYQSGDYVFLPEPFYFNQSIVRYNNNLYQCIVSNNDTEFVIGKWEILDSGDRQLNELDRIIGYYNPTINMPGRDLTQLVSGITYPGSTYMDNAFPPADEFLIDTELQDQPWPATGDEPTYTVQGEAFTYGYGPEELVPGIVTDNLTMIVNTRPGTNWSVGQYGHTGFNVVAIELTPTYPQTVYSFADVVQNPAFIAVYDIDSGTGLSTRIYEGYNYTVDWVSKTITLNSSLAINHILGVDLYEVGNGEQLQRSNSQAVPLIDNPNSGFTELQLSCNYVANKFNGNGVIRPGTEPLQVECIETDGDNNTITCTDVSHFTINSPIQFQGAVFGGVALDQTYYVKSISYITNKITIALPPLVDGIAGPTFTLIDATGSMQAVIQQGTGLVWSDPLVVHNGTKLILGESSVVTQTKSGTNSIVVNTSLTFDINDPVVFCNCITFTGVLEPFTTYYINSFIDANEFTVSATIGGPTIVLNDTTGFSSCVTNDYAIDKANVGNTAKLVFAQQYTQENDYITFAVFGETEPAQYSYSIPETQIYQSTGGETQLYLTNYIGGANPDNAVVELNGLRLVNNSDYTIDSVTNTLYLTFSLTVGDILAITSYNSTERQYLHTTLGGSYSGSSSFTLTIGSTTHLPGYSEDVTAGSFTIGTTYQITSLGTTDFTLIGAATNTVGEIFTATGSGTGTGTAGIGYGDSWSPSPDYLTLSSGTTSGLVVNLPIIFTSPFGGVITANTVYYINEVIDGTTFSISLTPGGDPLILTTATGSMLGFINPPRVSDITAINNIILAPLASSIVTSTSGTYTITANSTAGFVLNQPVMFKDSTATGFGGLSADGTVYWVSYIDVNGTDFEVSETQGGSSYAITPSTGAMYVYVGGNEAVTVTTGVPHNLTTNNIVRIDGVLGSTQLNNNTYYAKVITPYQIGLYLSPYQPESYQVNDPVTIVSNYISGGYVWLDKEFTLLSATGTASTALDNTITVSSVDYLVIDSPVYFSGNVFGGVTEGSRYYIKSIDAGTKKITISETYQGPEFDITTTVTTGSMGITIWEQFNVDRLWVTVNGYRVPSSSLYLNPNNNLSILTTLIPGDVVIITNMIPTSTPDELTYINNVNQSNIPTVYRANVLTTTWLTQPLSYTDETIYVEDVSKITTTSVQNETATVVSGECNIGLTVDKRIISQVIVVNNTTSTTLPSSAYSVKIIDTAPVLSITTDVSTGDNLTITVILGNLIYIAGEQIKFTIVDFDSNTLSGLQRGTNGTGERSYIPAYEKVYGILSTNLLPAVDYNLTWNSSEYNPTLGDPLQISSTSAANFLNSEF